MQERKPTYEKINQTMKLSYLLKQTSEAINRCRENELRRYNITPEQAGVLTCIYNIGENASPAELTRWLSRKPSSVSILLKRMEKQGLISKKTDLKKKNIFRLSLTRKGLEAYGYVREYNVFMKIFKTLSAARQQQLWELLKPLLDRARKSLGDDKYKYSFRIFDLKPRPYPDKLK
jgi:DNA-binding MarR family transcriptional regulator